MAAYTSEIRTFCWRTTSKQPVEQHESFLTNCSAATPRSSDGYDGRPFTHLPTEPFEGSLFRSRDMSKVWLITGAGRGMGVDIAKAALAAGHKVVATGRNTDKVSEAL